MELRSIKQKDGEYELVEVIIGDQPIMQALITVEKDEFVVTRLMLQTNNAITDAILDEYVENPPS